MFSSMRSRLAASLLTTFAVLAAVVALSVSGPAYAKPSPQQVEKQIDKAWNELEPVIEQYNRVHAQLKTNRARQAKLVAELKPLQTRVDDALSDVSHLATRAYMQGTRAGMTNMLITGDSKDLTDKLVYLDIIARQQRASVSDVITLRDKYAADKHELDAVTADLAVRDAELGRHRIQIQKRVDALQKLRIQAYGPGGGATGKFRTGPCPATYTPDAGGRAAKKACSLLGKPYIWAAAGPRGYDCSGLTLVAWAAAGVSLRHYTKWQWADTRPVSRADLKPGDLVFWYSDLHHMGMYVGDNTVVHATHTGDYVRMADMDAVGPIAGFRRPSSG